MKSTKLDQNARGLTQSKAWWSFPIILLLGNSDIQLSTALAQGTVFTYQGRLNSAGGAANGNYDFRFTVWNAESGGSLVSGTLGTNALGVSNGLFTATLDFGAGIFTGPDRWLEINVRTNGGSAFDALSPRQKLTPTPYAITAGNVASGGLAGTYGNAVTFSNGANSFTGTFNGNGAGVSNVNSVTLGGVAPSNYWRLGGNFISTAPLSLGTIDPLPLTIIAGNRRALRLESASRSAFPGFLIAPNLLGGSEANVISNGVLGATIGGGGQINQIIGFPFPSPQVVSDDFGTIGGGINNSVGNTNADPADARAATVSGGENNRAEAPHATLSGGSDNRIERGAVGSVIGGGNMNVVHENTPFGTISGGNNSRIEISAIAATIGGGQGNVVSENAIGSVIAGGGPNNIARDSVNSVISGGSGNEIDIDADTAAIGGGEFNRIGDRAQWASIGGGYGNFVQASTRYGTIGGGRENQIGGGGETATLAGGSNNFVGGAGGTVSGGRMNLSHGLAATVPGGQNNDAIGDFSFAAGRRAKAIHPGSFVWADSTDADFGSTAADQFIVRATNGVGINTRSPGAMLQVGDPNTPDSQGMIRFASRAGIGAGSRYWDIGVPEDDFDINGKFFSFVIDDPLAGTDPEVVVRWGTGNVGIGVNHPTSRLHVGAGGVRCEMGLGEKFSLGGNGSFEIDAPGIIAGRFVVQNGGNVGIGIASPSEKLHVVGNVRVDGNICAFNVACPSDRNVKTGFASVDAKVILEKVAALSITRWRYTNDTATPHIGPVAQDFHAAFGVGSNDKQISTVDADGVALAAIQGLNQKLEEQGAELTARNVELSSMRSELAELKQLVSRLVSQQNGK